MQVIAPYAQRPVIQRGKWVSLAVSGADTSRTTATITIPRGALLTAFCKHESGLGHSFTLRGPVGKFSYTTHVANGAAFGAGYGIVSRGYAGPITFVYDTTLDWNEVAVGYFTGIDPLNPLINSVSATGSSASPSPGSLDSSLSAGEALYVWGAGCFSTVSFSSPLCGGEAGNIESQANDTMGVLSHIARSGGSSRAMSATVASASWAATGLVFRAAKLAEPIRARRRTTPAGGQSAAIGLATETDTAFSFGRLKARAIGLNTETDSALAMARKKTRATGLTTETDSVFALGRAKSKALGLNTESDSALPITSNQQQVVAIGLVTETDSAFAFGRSKQRATALVEETDSALAMQRRKSKTVGLNTETDSALSVRPNRLKPIGLATETDTAFSFGRLKAKLLGLAAESDSALGMVAVGFQRIRRLARRFGFGVGIR